MVSPPEALTGQVRRSVMTFAKVTPVIDGKAVPTALIMQCSTDSEGKTVPIPQLVVALTSLTGIGHFKKLSARYRFDEGPVRDFQAESITGKNHGRAIALPRPPDLSNIPEKYRLPELKNLVDPGVEIAGAARLRAEFNFMSAGVTFLDFNVSGATQAINALGCQ
jgi:hypothetical protein